MTAIKGAFKPWGRATRPEFWWVMAVLFGSVILATVIDSTVLAEVDPSSPLYLAATAIFVIIYVPWLILALLTTLRRLHDMDMSAWYALLYFLGGLGFIALAIICARQGTFGPNRFGLDPRYNEDGWEADIFG